MLDRGSDILERLTGRRPVGYRAPGAELSEHTLALLAERGFVYDSSLMGNDVPYVVDAGTGSIVVVPTHWELNDVAYFNYAPQLGIRQYMATPEHVYSVWTSAFEGAYHYGRSLVLMMHPYVIGRPGRLRMLARLIRDMQSYPERRLHAGHRRRENVRAVMALIRKFARDERYCSHCRTKRTVARTTLARVAAATTAAMMVIHLLLMDKCWCRATVGHTVQLQVSF